MGFSLRCSSFLSEALHLLAFSVCTFSMLICGCHHCSLNHIDCDSCPFPFSLSPVSLSCASEDVSNLFFRFSYNFLYLLLCFQFWTVDFLCWSLFSIHLSQLGLQFGKDCGCGWYLLLGVPLHFGKIASALTCCRCDWSNFLYSHLAKSMVLCMILWWKAVLKEQG